MHPLVRLFLVGDFIVNFKTNSLCCFPQRPQWASKSCLVDTHGELNQGES